MTSKEAKEFLAEFLRRNRVSQVEFAKMIGKSDVTISRWLNKDKPLSGANINAIRFVIWRYSTDGRGEAGSENGISSAAVTEDYCRISAEAVERFRTGLIDRLIMLDIDPAAKDAILKVIASFRRNG